MSVHSDFILTPISNILDDVAALAQSMGGGIEMYPLWDHIMQSVFIKMAGAQEQKMKCVCWEIASEDFDLRRKMFFKWELNECSTFEDKRQCIKHLMNGICNLNKEFDVDTILDADKIWDDTKSVLANFYEQLKGIGFCDRAYNEYAEIFSAISSDCIATNSLYKNCDNCKRGKPNSPSACSDKKNLVYMYRFLYNYRNQCAHNTHSYQQNLPSLDTLYNIDYVYENYFIRFALLLIIDKIVVSLYKVFQEEIEAMKLF